MMYRKRGNFFFRKKIFSIGGIGPKIWDLGIFSDFCTFFRVAKNLIYINNAFNSYRYLKSPPPKKKYRARVPTILMPSTLPIGSLNRYNPKLFRGDLEVDLVSAIWPPAPSKVSHVHVVHDFSCFKVFFLTK